MTPTRTRFLLLACLLLGACPSPVVEQATPTRTATTQSLYAAEPAPTGAVWKFNGGDGTAYGDASAACQAFANSYGQGLVVDRLESTASAGTKTCWVRAPEDKTSSQSTLVFVEGEGAAVALADAADLGAIEAALVEIAKKCEDEIGQPTGNTSCAELGRSKHTCAAATVARSQELRGGPATIFSGPAFDRWGNTFGKNNPSGNVPPLVPRTEAAIEAQAIGYFQSGTSPYKTIGQAIAAAKKGKLFPDVVVATDPTKVLKEGNIAAIYDFKFPCPPDKEAAWGFNKTSGKRQDRAYNEALDPGQNTKRVQPTPPA